MTSPAAAGPGTDAPAPGRRLPLAVYALAVGTFCLGTSEFMVAGLLPQISTGLRVSIPAAGLLVTAFALGMTLGAPVTALATLRLPRRATLLGATAVFAAAHLVPFVSSSYAVQVAGRVVAAVACATFWSVAAVLAMRLAGPGRTARAMAVVVGGLTLANILGVPAGTVIGEHFGWRAAFVAVALATVAVSVLLRFLVPADPRRLGDLRTRDLARAELSAFRGRRLWLALATTATFQAAVFCAFTYLAPLLTEVSGLAAARVPLVLLLFGLGSFIGVTVGGRVADRDPLRNVVVSLVLMTLTLVLLVAVAGHAAAATVAVFLLGATSFSIAAAINSRVLTFAAEAPTLAASVNVSAFNTGNAVGPAVGAALIGGGLGLRAPLWAAVALGVLALVIAGASWRVERRPGSVSATAPATGAPEVAAVGAAETGAVGGIEARASGAAGVAAVGAAEVAAVGAAEAGAVGVLEAGARSVACGQAS